MHGVHIWRTQLLCLVWEVIKQKQYFSTNTISNRTNSLCASICLYLQYCNRVRKALQNATFKIKQKQWANKKQQLNRSQSHYVTDWLTDWLYNQRITTDQGRGAKERKMYQVSPIKVNLVTCCLIFLSRTWWHGIKIQDTLKRHTPGHRLCACHFPTNSHPFGNFPPTPKCAWLTVLSLWRKKTMSTELNILPHGDIPETGGLGNPLHSCEPVQPTKADEWK